MADDPATDDSASDHRDLIQSAFGELRASVLPSMRPIGVEHVVRTVRRRRNTRAALATVVVLLVGGGVYALGGLGGSPITPTVSSESSNHPIAVGSPAATMTASPLPSATVQMPASPRPPHRTVAPTHTPSKVHCALAGTATRTGGGEGTVTLTFRASNGTHEQPCTGIEVPVFWASYSVNADGSGSLYSDEVNSLRTDRQTITFRLQIPPGCGAYFVGHTVTTLPPTLPSTAMGGGFGPVTGGPFWDQKRNESVLVEQGRVPCASASPSVVPSIGAGTPSP